jgi:hypothetical protein
MHKDITNVEHSKQQMAHKIYNISLEYSIMPGQFLLCLKQLDCADC